MCEMLMPTQFRVKAECYGITMPLHMPPNDAIHQLYRLSKWLMMQLEVYGQVRAS